MPDDEPLTIFSVPKVFEGHIGVIQRNAIRSWAQLPHVRILLLGDERGTSDMAREVGAVHIAGVRRNDYGTPYVSSCFEVATAAFPAGVLAYVNADIILMRDFVSAVARVARRRRPFLMAGQRTNLDLRAPLVFEPGWEADLQDRAQRDGHLFGPSAIDYFVFRPGLFTHIPPFAIGRWVWDNWLLFDAVRTGATLVDATASVRVIHQTHGYDHVGVGNRPLKSGPEAAANFALAPDWRHWYDLNHATRLLCRWGLIPAWTPVRLRQRVGLFAHNNPRVAEAVRRVKRGCRTRVAGRRAQ